VRVFFTAPTLIRSLMQYGDQWVTAYDRSSLRLLGTAGEPINPHAFQWYRDVSAGPSSGLSLAGGVEVLLLGALAVALLCCAALRVKCYTASSMHTSTPSIHPGCG